MRRVDVADLMQVYYAYDLMQVYEHDLMQVYVYEQDGTSGAQTEYTRTHQ